MVGQHCLPLLQSGNYLQIKYSLYMTTCSLSMDAWTLFLVLTKSLHKMPTKIYNCCIHFVDGQEADSDEDQEEFFHDTKVVVDDTTAVH